MAALWVISPSFPFQTLIFQFTKEKKRGKRVKGERWKMRVCSGGNGCAVERDRESSVSWWWSLGDEDEVFWVEVHFGPLSFIKILAWLFLFFCSVTNPSAQDEVFRK